EALLLNPLTLNCFRAPILGDVVTGGRAVGFGFGYANNDYKVVFLVQKFVTNGIVNDDKSIQVHVYSVESNSWRSIGDGGSCMSYKLTEIDVQAGVCVNNHLLYWILYSPNLGKNVIACFDLCTEKWNEILLSPDDPNMALHIRPSEYFYLSVDMNGSLCFRSWFDPNCVWTLKKNGDDKYWDATTFNGHSVVPPLLSPFRYRGFEIEHPNKNGDWYAYTCLPNLIVIGDGQRIDLNEKEKENKYENKNLNITPNMNMNLNMNNLKNENHKIEHHKNNNHMSRSHKNRSRKGLNSLTFISINLFPPTPTAFSILITFNYKKGGNQKLYLLDLDSPGYPAHYLQLPPPSCDKHCTSLEVVGTCNGLICLKYTIIPFSNKNITFFIILNPTTLCLSIIFQGNMDLLIMKEYGVQDSWTKLVSVAPTIHCQYAPILACENNGARHEILLRVNGEKYVWYNIRDKTTKAIQLNGTPHYVSAPLLCLGSLVTGVGDS
ncbi:hypothetical protein RDABS01_034477, partial [Bienertia sinuspersici]